MKALNRQIPNDPNKWLGFFGKYSYVNKANKHGGYE